jgi:hypothetical protein
MVNDNVRRQPPPGLESIAWHCTCGVSCEFTAEPHLAALMRSRWEAIHTGEGHAPTDERGAEASRDHDFAQLEDMFRSARWGQRPPAEALEV